MIFFSDLDVILMKIQCPDPLNYEAMYHGLICFRYRNNNDIYLGLKDQFNDASDLKNLIKQFKNIKPDLLSNEVEKLLIDSLGLGINKYEEILS